MFLDITKDLFDDRCPMVAFTAINSHEEWGGITLQSTDMAFEYLSSEGYIIAIHYNTMVAFNDKTTSMLPFVVVGELNPSEHIFHHDLSMGAVPLFWGTFHEGNKFYPGTYVSDDEEDEEILEGQCTRTLDKVDSLDRLKELISFAHT